MFDQIKAELCSWWGGDRDAANAAWASTNDLKKLLEKTPEDVIRVTSGLATQHHDTPKERVWMEFFITCPIFVERQFDKYRMTVQFQQFVTEFFQAPFGRDGITQNELSGRYRTIPERPYEMPDDVARIMAKAFPYMMGISQESMAAGVKTDYARMLQMQYDWYETELKKLREAEKSHHITNAEYKRAREVLRGVLGTAYLTDMRIVLNMNALEHIINQRIDKHAQPESQMLAVRLLQAVEQAQVAPNLVAEMAKENGWNDRRNEIFGYNLKNELPGEADVPPVPN